MSDELKILVSVAAVALASFGGPILAYLKGLAAKAAQPVVPPAPVAPTPVSPAEPSAALDGETFAGAITCLSVVRSRLVKTACLDEPSAAAIETITHSLVKGSDK